jgi:hypothetical protein
MNIILLLIIWILIGSVIHRLFIGGLTDLDTSLFSFVGCTLFILFWPLSLIVSLCITILNS